MKTLRIRSELNGRFWVAETSDGKRSSGTSLKAAIEHLVPHSVTNPSPIGLEPLSLIFDNIKDSGEGIVGRGQASA